MGERLRQVPAGCWVLFGVAVVLFIGSLVTHGTTSFALRMISLLAVLLSIAYRFLRLRRPSTSPPA